MKKTHVQTSDTFHISHSECQRYIWYNIGKIFSIMKHFLCWLGVVWPAFLLLSSVLNLRDRICHLQRAACFSQGTFLFRIFKSVFCLSPSPRVGEELLPEQGLKTFSFSASESYWCMRMLKCDMSDWLTEWVTNRRKSLSCYSQLKLGPGHGRDVWQLNLQCGDCHSIQDLPGWAVSCNATSVGRTSQIALWTTLGTRSVQTWTWMS